MTARRSLLAPVILAGIMLGGLWLRLIPFLASLPFGHEPFIRDEGNYVGLAVPLSQGYGFVEKWVWMRPPGYPLFLAAFMAPTGGNMSAAIFAQLLLSVANIGFMYLLTLEVFGFRQDVAPGKARAVALVAAGLLALNPHVAFYANLAMPETLYMLLLTFVVWAMLRALKVWHPSSEARVSRRALGWVAAAALAAASAVLVRSLLLSFVPILLAWFWWVLPRSGEGQARRPLWGRRSGKALAPLALFVVLLFAAILPWTVRNYIRYNRFLLVDTMGGYNLWQYNDKVGLNEIYTRLEQIPNMVDRGKYASQQGMKAILSDLPAFAGTAFERLADAWPVDYFGEFRAFVRDKYPGTDCTNLDIFGWLGTPFYVALGLLGIWGFMAAPGRTFKVLALLVLAHYAATTMLAHAEFRYRMPLYPFVTVYAAWPVVGLFERVANWRKKKTEDRGTAERGRPWPLLVAGAVSALFFVQCLFFILPGLPNSIKFERRYLAGKEQLARGDYAAALASFTGASQVDRACACMYRYIGLAQGGLGKTDEERASYNAAISREPQDWRTRALLSDRLRSAGDPHAANPISLTRPAFRASQQHWAWAQLPPPGVFSIDIGGADIGYVQGFQSAESEPDPASGGQITYRWTTESSMLRLAAPPGSGDGKLVLRWHSLAWPGKPDPDATITVLVDGRAAGTLTAHAAWGEATLNVGPVVAGKVVVVELHSPVARPPGDETRLLGVAIDSARLER